MASVNKVIIVGNLGSDPEQRTTQGGKSCAVFSVATNQRWTDRQTGELQERTEWVRVTAWGTTGQNCLKYLAKASPVYVEGRLETHEWENDGEGNPLACGKKHYQTIVIAERVQFLGRANGPQQGSADAAADADDPEFPAVDTTTETTATSS